MLTLTRRAGQRIVIGSEVEVEVVSVNGGRVRIGIRAPRELSVHRGELIDRIEAENQMASRGKERFSLPPVDESAVITFPDGLFGLANHRRFVVCELNEPLRGEQASEADRVRALVSIVDPSIRLLAVDACTVDPNFPVEAARIASRLGGRDDGDAGSGESELAVAAIVTAPADGGVPTVNLAAPLVIGLESRRGVQVILDPQAIRSAGVSGKTEVLSVRHPLTVDSGEPCPMKNRRAEHQGAENES